MTRRFSDATVAELAGRVGTADTTAPPLRVLVVSASMGAGHDAAAGELRRRVTASGHDALVVDMLNLGGRDRASRLRWTYGTVLRHAPWLYGGAMRAWQRWPRAVGAVMALGNSSYEPEMLECIARYRPDIVVSTYNLAAHVLGGLRRKGRLDVPLVTYVTDPGAHPYWVDAGVDMHLAVTPETAAGLRALGANDVVQAGPLVRPEFRDLPSRGYARRALDLPPDAHVVLVTAGSWGVGDIEGTARTVAAEPGLLPVTLCGRDASLRRRLTEAGAGRAIGWTDEMPTLMAAADVLIDNAGGLTCLEALVAGLPVVQYHPIPGHGLLNTRTLHASGRTWWARDARELVFAIRSLARDGVLRRRQVARGLEVTAGDAAGAVVDHGLAARGEDVA